MGSWENAHKKVMCHNGGGRAEHCTLWGTKGGITQTLIQVICLMGFHSLSFGSPVV